MKNNKDLEIQLSKILINIEWDIWSTNLTILCLENLINSISIFKHDSLEHFYKEFEILFYTIKNTKPKIWIIIHYISKIYDIIYDNKWKYQNIDEIYKELDLFLKNIKKEINTDNKNLVEKWASAINNNDTIFIHSPSSIVKQVVYKAHKSWKKIKIILAQQSEDKTNNMIYFLQENKIEFLVIPEFMLSNIEWDIDKMLVWWVTFNSEHQFIVSAWTNAAVSEMHYANKPVYMFLSTKKFSLWQSEANIDHAVYKTKEIISVDKKINPYKRVKFSHDRVDGKLFDKIFTEIWEMNYKEIVSLYKERFVEKEEWRKTHFIQKEKKQ